MSYTFEELREKHKTFFYKGYNITETDREIIISYDFEIHGLATFCPSWKMEKPYGKKMFKYDRIFKELVFSLGMVELVSYWKITCAPVVKVLCGKLSEKQISFWKKLYFSGLGEFFYKNKITTDLDSFMTIRSEGEIPDGDERRVLESDNCLIAIGGGKDSVVSLEVLGSNFLNNYCYIINPRGATVECAKTAGYDGEKIVSLNRTLDSEMLRLNSLGYLNGHTPFSAIVAFSSVLSAYVYDIKYVVLSNEASANESTVKNSDVNHQYSKSFEFEKNFHEYEEEFIGSGVYYFSLLRPMSELQIAEYFAQQTKYHSVFQSCNVGSKENKWCAECSKCLFVSIILSPFMEISEIEKIFNKNLLDDKNMEEYFTQLIGISDEKPFECVGSRDEINTALCMAISRLEEKGEKLPYLFEVYKNTQLYNEFKNKPNAFKGYFNEENLLPEKWKKLLLRECY
ncbi:MAG: hypothetical protein IJ031_02690 [Oscillospiraceae bacterium]|nr:hypothetical protein [Oscillospiraceae bacterium]MBQ8883488.1 hypothetical protein [Oscillospiraceae bacterium]